MNNLGNKIILIRHGESQWNKENRFTGWCDIDLSEQGHDEAKKAGKIIKKHSFSFDYSYTSMLKRAIHTLWHVLDEIDQTWLNVEKSWRLNERHYGALQGLNKTDIEKKYGKKQIKQWRRSYLTIPPQITQNSIYFPGKDIRYNDVDKNMLPLGESLEMTAKRVIPFWECCILPRIKEGKKILIVAHGNSIRALIKYLSNIKAQEISELDIPTGIPIVYEFHKNFHSAKYYYLD
ncbi:2,3-diphosphoglycerate-dependent phosphoglycerate mutase [Candidatus Tachikawaea gelatinosa]|uniref:2,3-bisphosphoglycerate-dependent phosphoglycerate mutase n=1 Tax=Candidatus Tachikawaea gelatinosa TaxID=1410383 RepID=A0A090ALB5_9ENTR|nr:2,3-diphosphoglycerate-dependent phosphoglycerate mutase [Candidatus Tachikawaea gelatinosa]BAP58414.1 2 3-bisphosphoglycerate-dependent phosphoglycerate mutase [Candidatus Tachikawaea gelatinosa]